LLIEDADPLTIADDNRAPLASDARRAAVMAQARKIGSRGEPQSTISICQPFDVAKYLLSVDNLSF
jgi:hypothetical protein